MGIEDTVSAAARYAADDAQDLADTQTGLRGRSPDPSGHRRPAGGAAPIDLGILDHMVASRAELVEHARAHADVTAPVPREHAAVYAWYEQHSAHLDEEAFRAGEALVYRQALEARVLARAARGFWPERCPSCSCFSLMWHPADRVAVCRNIKYDSGDDGRPRRFTLAQIADKAVENLAIRAAT